MSFDPSNVGGRPTTHKGTYRFTITRAQHRVFSTGTEGFDIEMDVFLDDDRVIKAYENLFYTKRALWKVQSLCNSVGLDFNSRPKVEEYVGTSGKAFFSRKGDRRWLEAEEFFPREGSEVIKKQEPAPASAPPEPPPEEGPPPQEDEPPEAEAWPF